MKTFDTTRRATLAILLGMALAGSAAAGDRDWYGAGASGGWRDLLGAQEIGGTHVEPRAGHGGGSHRMSTKLKAGALSLLVPGAGQILVNGDREKGFIMMGAEAAIWGAFLVFDHQGDGWADDYREWAGIYAGTQGDHGDYYWQSVGRYSDSDAYYESQLREARAFGEATPDPLPASDAWQWRNATYQGQYQGMRADASRAYDRRDFMILFAILNRAVSAFDAVRNAGHGDEPALGARVMGLDLAVDISPSLRHPEARCGLGRSF